MSVKRALYEYLTQKQDLTGPAAVPFVRLRNVSGLMIANRNDARRWFRDKVGGAVYSGRRPQSSEHSQVYLRTAYTSPIHDLKGQMDATQELVDVIVATTGHDAAARAETIADLITLACGGWKGGAWGDTEVHECLLDGRTTRTYSPIDGGDKWTYEVALGLDIIYIDEAAPMYPADDLAALISYAGTGTLLRVSALNSTIPEGRTLTNVQWTIREIGAGGTILLQFAGSPGAAVTTTDVGGTYAEPAILKSAYSISGPIHITLTITDSAGFVASTGDLRNE